MTHEILKHEVDPRADARAAKEKQWREMTVLERIRQTVREQEMIERSAVVGAGEKILEKRRVRLSGAEKK